MSEPADRTHFLNLAGIFEGGMVFVALGLAWALGIDVAGMSQPRLAVVATGVLAAVPPFLFLLATERFPIAPLVRIKKIILDTLGEPLAACRWYDLVLLAALAGFGEELLFRGVAQSWFERWGAVDGWNRVIALLLSNVIFGLLHCITPTYAILAGAMGIYFGLLLDITGSRNLLAPILAHAVYDYLAFLVLVRAQRMEQSNASDKS